jgi:DNA-binding XRE family transcriptional regulator
MAKAIQQKTKTIIKPENSKNVLTENPKLIIAVEYRQHFNKHLFFPVNELARKMLDFRHRKSFIREEVEFLKSIGFDFEITFPTPTFNEIMGYDNKKQAVKRKA